MIFIPVDCFVLLYFTVFIHCFAQLLFISFVYIPCGLSCGALSWLCHEFLGACRLRHTPGWRQHRPLASYSGYIKSTTTTTTIIYRNNYIGLIII
jgi:hypothetical protein